MAKILKLVFSILLVVTIINENLRPTEAKIIKNSDSHPDHFIHGKIRDDNHYYDPGYLHSRSKGDESERQPRTFFIPIGNWFNKPQNIRTTTTSAPISTTGVAITTTTTPLKIEDQVALVDHNTLRLIHDAPPLIYNQTLKSLAQDCANYHARLNDYSETPIPSMNPLDGNCPDIRTSATPGATESYYSFPTTNGVPSIYESFRTAISFWYNDGQKTPPVDYTKYDWETKRYFQIIWKNTTDFACARSTVSGPNPPAYMIVSCIYNLPGNVGSFMDNVQPPP